jgi:hypothetical protein
MGGASGRNRLSGFVQNGCRDGNPRRCRYSYEVGGSSCHGFSFRRFCETQKALRDHCDGFASEEIIVLLEVDRENYVIRVYFSRISF